MKGSSAHQIDALPLSGLCRVDEICLRFEAAWKAGQHPLIDSYLGATAEPERSVLLRELLVLDLAYRHRQGDKPAPEEYRLHFPGHGELIASVFAEAEPSTSPSAQPAEKTLDPKETGPVWYCARDKKKAGPFSWQQLQQLAATGRLRPSDMIWREGSSRWISATSAQGLFPGGENAGAGQPCPPGHAANQGSAAGDDPYPTRSIPSEEKQVAAGASMPETDTCFDPGGGSSEVHQLGPYKVLRRLGAGGMGMVLQAEDTLLHRLVALKVMHADLARNEKGRKRFLREARNAAAVKHDHIVTIYSVGEDRDVPFLAMEFLEGETLDDRLKREEAARRTHPDAPGHRFGTLLSIAEMLRIGREIAAGLAAAHEHGLIHRDIKPANIWLETQEPIHAPAPPPSGSESTSILEQAPRSLTIPVPRGRVKILDFGLARATDDEPLTRKGDILGTPAYMSPEQALGEPIDQRCDLFSLGCVLYRMCTGKLPFKGSSTTAMLLALARDQPRPLREVNPELPPALNDLVMRLLARDARERPASAHAVVKAIKAIEHELASGTEAKRPAAPSTAQPATGIQTELATGPHAVPSRTAVSPEDAGQGKGWAPEGMKAGAPKKQIGDSATEVLPPPSRPVPFWRQKRLLMGAGLLVAAAAILLAGTVIYVKTDKGTLRIETENDDVTVIVEQGGKQIQVIDTKTGKEVRLQSGEYRLRLGKESEDIELAPDHVTLKRGETAVATITPVVNPVAEVVKPANPVAEPMKPSPAPDLGTKRDKDRAAFDAWCQEVAQMPPEKQVEAVARKLQELNPAFDGKVTHKIEGGVVTELGFFTDTVTDISPVRALTELEAFSCKGSGPRKGKLSDLSPLKDMKLTKLVCFDTKVSDLSPLKDVPLTILQCNETRVSDLSPLKDMKLTDLECWNTPVSDLSPLKDMKLTYLVCSQTRVSDLSPLKDMKLTYLECWGTKVSDLSPLKGMPLKKLWYGYFKPERDAEILRSIKTLETINKKPAAEFWKKVDADRAAFDGWCQEVAKMPPEKQVEAVAAKLQELNPGFDGKVMHKVKGGVVTQYQLIVDNITDISPVRALLGLRELRIQGTGTGYKGNGKLADLSPLSEMKLTRLYCDRTRLSELSALKGMPLTSLECYATLVSDLSPLKDMELTYLACWSTRVSDLSPLKDMKLNYLYCGGTSVSDLSPLKGMPLKDLTCDFKPFRDAEILRSIKTLEKINEQPATEFWKKVDTNRAAFDGWCQEVAKMPPEKQVEAVATKLQELNSGFDGKVTPKIEDGVVTSLEFVTNSVTDISPVRALTGLQHLNCWGTPSASKRSKLSDLSPLNDMKLTKLGCSFTEVSDLSPLKNMKLTHLWCRGTPVSDLSPLQGMKLTELHCPETRVSDLSPLKDMKLTCLECSRTPVSDLSPLQGMKLTELHCPRTQVSDLSPLKDMRLTFLHCSETEVSNLSPLNGMPLTELHIGHTPVRDLASLRGMPLQKLYCDNTLVSDLSPLRGAPLIELHCYSTQVSSLAPLTGMPLKKLKCDFIPGRDASILRSIKTLETINDQPTTGFWKSSPPG